MLIITIHVNAPAGQAIGIKEDLAAYLERFGDSRVVSVEEAQPARTAEERCRAAGLEGEVLLLSGYSHDAALSCP